MIPQAPLTTVHGHWRGENLAHTARTLAAAEVICVAWHFHPAGRVQISIRPPTHSKQLQAIHRARGRLAATNIAPEHRLPFRSLVIVPDADTGHRKPKLHLA